MVNANHIPFLRFKKPQSPFLSHMLRKKTKERENRITRTTRLEDLLPVAEDEDLWDAIVRRTNGISSKDNGTTWASATWEALSHVRRIRTDNTIKRMNMAQRMFDIMEGERKLAEQERLMRRDQRHQAYKARRKLREATTFVAEQPPVDEHTPMASAAAN